MKILFVCLGNICRSPLAQGILEQKVKERGLDWEIDSAGTGHWHLGEQPDPRSVEVARENNIQITAQRARQITKQDFAHYDLILVMDNSNLRDVQALAQSPQEREKVKLIREFSDPGKNYDVPDPYFDDDGFQQVYDLLDHATDKLIEAYRNR